MDLQRVVAVAPLRAEQRRDPLHALVERVDMDVEGGGGTAQVAVAGEVGECGAHQIATEGLVVLHQRTDRAADEEVQFVAGRRAQQDAVDAEVVTAGTLAGAVQREQYVQAAGGVAVCGGSTKEPGAER